MLCEIGIITKTQGLKGHFRVRISYSNFSMLAGLKNVIICGNEYNVEKITHRDGFEIFKLKEINTIDDAEQFRNQKIFTNIDEKKELDKDEFYIQDLIGSKVVVRDKEIGIVKDILSFGSADIFVILSDSKESLIPFVKGLVKNFNNNSKILVFNEDRFNEVGE